MAEETLLDMPSATPEKDSVNTAPTKLEENAVEIKSIISETNNLDTVSMISKTNCSHGAPLVTGNGSNILPITGETNALDNEEMIAEVNGSDTAPVVGDEEIEIKEVSEVTEPEVIQSGRLSAEKAVTKVKKVRVQPRYLGGFAGSCHDYCKYGIKHQTETKPWKSLRKRRVTPQKEGEDTRTIEIFVAKSKEISSAGPKNVTGSTAENSDDFFSGKNGIKEGNYKVSSEQKEGARIIRAPARPKVSGARVKKKNSDGSKYVKTGSSEENEKTTRKAKPEDSNDEHVPEKTLYVVESSPRNGSPSSSMEKKSSKGARVGTRNGSSLPPREKKMVRSGQSEVNARKVTPPPAKALRPVKHEARSAQPSCSASKARRPSKSSSSTSLCDQNQNSSGNRMFTSKTENKERPKRTVIKIASPQKVNFRRGKVVEPQPEGSTPRRLKFKRRVLLEKQDGKGDATRRRFKDSATGLGGCSETKPERVVLKHRKSEGKKKVQILFNNVIEETATKLAEAKKSKVKALVGAFETVISLQDDKTSSPKPRRPPASTMKA